MPFGRCTRKGNTLYVHVFDWPQAPLALDRLETPIQSAHLLRDLREVKVTKVGRWPALVLPTYALDPLDTVVKVQLAGPPEVDNAIRPADDGTITLPAAVATIHGTSAKYEGDKDCIGYWVKLEDWVSWELISDKDAEYAVTITYATEKDCGGGTWNIGNEDTKLVGECKETGSWSTFITEPVEGMLKVKRGKTVLSVRPTKITKVAVMNLRAITLKPVD